MPPIETPMFEFTPEQIKYMTLEQYAIVRQQLLDGIATLKPTHQGNITIPNPQYVETLTCMWCAAPFPTMEELEEHEADPH